MPTNIVAAIYIIMALSIGTLLTSLWMKDRRLDIFNIYKCWVILTAILFLIPWPAMYFILSALTLWYFTPKNSINRVRFYTALLPAIPTFVTWNVPAPFINRLLNLDYIILINMVVLLPLFLSKKTAKEKSRNKTEQMAKQAFTYAGFFFLMVILLDFRDTSLTNGVRLATEEFLTALLVLFTIARFGQTTQAAKEALIGIMIGGVLVASIALFQQLKGWTFYMSIPQPLEIYNVAFANIQNFRSGALRIGSTMSPIPFGLYMATCLGLTMYFRASGYRNIYSLFVFMLLTIGLYYSDSRAAWLGAVTIITFYYIFSSRGSSIRPLFKFGITVLLILLAVIDWQSILVSYDNYGTFSYRFELIENAREVIQENFWLGSPDFISHHALEASRQGQGIIDIVNYYLRLILQYGFITLVLFCLSIALLIRAMFKARHQLELNKMWDEERTVRITLAIFVTLIVFISTVSLVDRLYQIVWLFFALGFGLVMAKNSQTNNAAQSFQSTEISLDSKNR